MAVADRILNHLSKMPDAENDARQSLAPEQLELVHDEWFPRHLNQRFRYPVTEWAQARGQSTG